MNRRHFLSGSVIAGGLAVGAGGFLFVRRTQARTELKERLLDEAMPPLTTNALRELQTLPARAREEIKRYFHGKCLNVESFVSHICSTNFRERIGRCHTRDECEECFLQAFCSRVATEAEILNQIDTIATEVGSELDIAWSSYCAQLSSKWSVRIKSYGSPLTVDDLTVRLSGLIREDIRQAIQKVATGTQVPALGQTIDKIGHSAVMLLPLVRYKQMGMAVGIPVFLVLAAKHVWDYIMARIDDPRDDYQAAISGRLAMLGNRVGAEFEREVRQRLSDLHTWQERSLHETASRLAEERVNLL